MLDDAMESSVPAAMPAARRLGHLGYFIKYHLPPSRTGLAGVGTRSHIYILPLSPLMFSPLSALLFVHSTLLKKIDSPT